MGTQFSSRLSDSDRKRIVREIVDLAADLAAPRGRRAAGGGGGGARRRRSQAAARAPSIIPPGERRKFGELVVGLVITVAESHNLSGEFGQSSLFEEVLEWLKRLWSDAVFNGFLYFIKEYELDHAPSPVAVLNQKLRGLTTIEQAMGDRFRVAVSNAAKHVLAEAASRTISSTPGESAAQRFGRQLATMDLRSLVTRYVAGFVYEVVSAVIHRADPEGMVPAAQQAALLIQDTADRVAKRILARVIKEGRLQDSAEIHLIVRAGLQDLAGPSKPPGPEPKRLGAAGS